MNGREFCFMQNVQNDLKHENLPVVTHCGNEACTQCSHFSNMSTCLCQPLCTKDRACACLCFTLPEIQQLADIKKKTLSKLCVGLVKHCQR